ncbi:hypothetical protein, partial [Paenibacillus mucilaginosus]|uniref:hypothetical protein n=1 Tax=Paenibacillus mucilaginosus TaxID=61624 RepID=UPI003D222990
PMKVICAAQKSITSNLTTSKLKCLTSISWFFGVIRKMSPILSADLLISAQFLLMDGIDLHLFRFKRLNALIFKQTGLIFE